MGALQARKRCDAVFESAKRVRKMAKRHGGGGAPAAGSGWFGMSSSASAAQPETFPAALIRLEADAAVACAELIRSILSFFGMSPSSLLSGLMAIRRSYTAFKGCDDSLVALEEAHATPTGPAASGQPPGALALLQSVRGALDYGNGLLNLVISQIPPKVKSVISWIGLRGDFEV